MEVLLVKEESGIHSAIAVGIGVGCLRRIGPREVRSICHLVRIKQVYRRVCTTRTAKANWEIGLFYIIGNRVATHENVFGALELVLEQLPITGCQLIGAQIDNGLGCLGG